MKGFISALVLLFLTGMGLCQAQTPFRHVQHNHKLSASSKKELLRQASPLNSSHNSSPDLHPAHTADRRSSLRFRRRHRSAPQPQRYSSQDLYLEIRQGVGMENLKAQNRKLWSGK